jgi:predicted N-acetyltransferase YhbS
MAMNTRNNRIVGGVIFYMVCVVSEESLLVCLSPLIVARPWLGKQGNEEMFDASFTILAYKPTAKR